MKVLLIDDHRTDAGLLEHHCRAVLAGGLEQFVVVESTEAAAHLRIDEFDVVLLEPALQSGDGFRWVGASDQFERPTIVVSQQCALAVRAFDFGAVDFVPKPITCERLAKALGRVAPRATARGLEDRIIAVRRHGRIEFVPVTELLYVRGTDKYAELVHANGQRSFYDKCLGHLEAALPRSFLRIHKSYLVRLSLVSRLIVQRGSRYFAELKTGHRLPVGRSRYAHVKSQLIL